VKRSSNSKAGIHGREVIDERTNTGQGPFDGDDDMVLRARDLLRCMPKDGPDRLEPQPDGVYLARTAVLPLTLLEKQKGRSWVCATFQAFCTIHERGSVLAIVRAR
jgi:hypothetical protein